MTIFVTLFDLPLSIPILDTKAAPGVVPFQGPVRAGHPATAALQAARILDQDLPCLRADGIESTRTDGKTRLELASTTDLLFDDDMGLLIVLKDVYAELSPRVHHILLNLHRSLRAARLNNPSFAPFHTVAEIRFLGPSPIQKISSNTVHSH